MKIHPLKLISWDKFLSVQKKHNNKIQPTGTKLQTFWMSHRPISPSAASIHTALCLELQGAPVVEGHPNIPPFIR